MKKIVIVASSIIICLLAITGCMKRDLPDLPSNAIEFDMETFHDIEHDDALYGSIEYCGRVYIPYGTINSKYKQSYIDSCIGYIRFSQRKQQSVTMLQMYFYALKPSIMCLIIFIRETAPH